MLKILVLTKTGLKLSMPIKPIKVGITGGIGSGKSVVCKIFNLLGVPVYDADQRARELMTENPSLIHAIKKLFGEKAYFQEGKLNKNYLAGMIFRDEKKLNLLNQSVHPAVAEDFEAWVQQHRNSTYLIKEAALLFESGSYKFLDYIVTVSAPLELRINRVLNRDSHRSKKAINDIISKQLDEKDKIEKSQFEIVNDNHSLLIPQVLKIHQKLITSVQAG